MWTPAEIRRLIAQLAGIGLGIGGIILIIQGVQTSGKINISSSILSGEIESGSAGLFLIFLGTILVALPIFWHSNPKNSSESSAVNEVLNQEVIGSPLLTKLIISAIILFIITVSLIFSGDYLLNKQGWRAGEALVVAGVFAGVVNVLVGLGVLFEWLSNTPAEKELSDRNTNGK